MIAAAILARADRCVARDAQLLPDMLITFRAVQPQSSPRRIALQIQFSDIVATKWLVIVSSNRDT